MYLSSSEADGQPDRFNTMSSNYTGEMSHGKSTWRAVPRKRCSPANLSWLGDFYILRNTFLIISLFCNWLQLSYILVFVYINFFKAFLSAPSWLEKQEQLSWLGKKMNTVLPNLYVQGVVFYRLIAELI